MTVPQAYSRVSVTPNGGKEYFPVSYDAAQKVFQYNLSTVYQTILQGKNTYIIKGYKGEQVVQERTLTVWYLDTPPLPEPVKEEPTTLDSPYVVVYFEDDNTTQLINQWKEFLQSIGGTQWFIFQGYTDPNSLEGKLTTKEYDIALRTINFGLKKDLSSLLNTDKPVINPSLKTNEALSSLITTYFLTDNEQQKNKLQQQIQDLHRQDPQLLIL